MNSIYRIMRMSYFYMHINPTPLINRYSRRVKQHTLRNIIKRNKRQNYNDDYHPGCGYRSIFHLYNSYTNDYRLKYMRSLTKTIYNNPNYMSMYDTTKISFTDMVYSIDIDERPEYDDYREPALLYRLKQQMQSNLFDNNED